MLAAHADRLAWSSPAELAAGTLAITGCVLSNELVDALPVHLVEMTAAGLQEVMVAAAGEEFCEQLAPPTNSGNSLISSAPRHDSCRRAESGNPPCC